MIVHEYEVLGEVRDNYVPRPITMVDRSGEIDVDNQKILLEKIGKLLIHHQPFTPAQLVILRIIVEKGVTTPTEITQYYKAKPNTIQGYFREIVERAVKYQLGTGFSTLAKVAVPRIAKYLQKEGVI